VDGRARDDVNFPKFPSVEIYRTHRVSPERLRRLSAALFIEICSKRRSDLHRASGRRRNRDIPRTCRDVNSRFSRRVSRRFRGETDASLIRGPAFRKLWKAGGRQRGQTESPSPSCRFLLHSRAFNHENYHSIPFILRAGGIWKTALELSLLDERGFPDRLSKRFAISALIAIRPAQFRG